MNEKIKKAVFLFIFTLIVIAWSEKYIGKTRTYGKPLHWDEIYNSIPQYLIFALAVSLAYLYFERNK